MAGALNYHGTAVIVGDRAILIRGEPGAGKTTLALAVLSWARCAGLFAALVSDDQVMLTACSGRLICSAPAAIAGLVEVVGRRPLAIFHESPAVLDLVVELVEPERAPRFAGDVETTIEGCNLTLFVLPRHNVQAAFGPLASYLGLPPFDKISRGNG